MKMVFKDLLDAFTKSKLIKEAYEDCGEMHYEVESMFNASFDCFHGKCSIQDVKKEDIQINKKLVNIRKKIIEYLAVNTSPNLNAALELTAIANEYERIGDYCKDLAELKTMYGINFDDNCQMCSAADKFQKLLAEQFTIVHDAVKNEDEALAEKSDEINEKIKKLRKQVITQINEHPEMNAKEAVICSKIAAYSRRISSHLENISTVVTNPYPEMGFRLGKYTDFEDKK